MILVLLVACLFGTTLADDKTCTSTCPNYTTCSSLTKGTKYNAFLNGSLVCDSDKDAEIGKLLKSTSECKLRDASALLSDMLGYGWEAVGVVEAYMGDEELWLPTCNFDNLAAAACVYYSLPMDADCVNASVPTRSDIFCKGFCKELFDGCINFKKYWHLEDEFEELCRETTTSDDTDMCFKGQIDQSGLTAPKCPKTPEPTQVSLTGPYALAGVGLALALVALIGLVLITCRNADSSGAPGSF